MHTCSDPQAGLDRFRSTSSRVATMYQTPFGLLFHVALLYLVLFWKSHKHRLRVSTCLGWRSLRRLERCAPQQLLRMHRKRCHVVSWLVIATSALQYGFCYYHGIHAKHWSAWLLAAHAIHCKYNNMHTATAKD